MRLIWVVFKTVVTEIVTDYVVVTEVFYGEKLLYFSPIFFHNEMETIDFSY